MELRIEAQHIQVIFFRFLVLNVMSLTKSIDIDFSD